MLRHQCHAVAHIVAALVSAIVGHAVSPLDMLCRRFLLVRAMHGLCGPPCCSLACMTFSGSILSGAPCTGAGVMAFVTNLSFCGMF
eukprot:7102180-Prorocentrum_lima.AAC.1